MFKQMSWMYRFQNGPGKGKSSPHYFGVCAIKLEHNAQLSHLKENNNVFVQTGARGPVLNQKKGPMNIQGM